IGTVNKRNLSDSQLFSLTRQETECEHWAGSQTDEDSDTEEIMYGIHESCATDLYHHPQLYTDIEAVRTLYSDAAVSIREFGSIDDVDVDLKINANILEEEVAKAWRINPSEPIVIRLHFSLSLYLDGPAPTVEVFQPSNKDNFSFGKQLQNFITESILKPLLTASSLLVSRSHDLQEPSVKDSIILPAIKLNHFTNHTTSYTIKNPTGELFTYTPSGKSVNCSMQSIQKSQKLLNFGNNKNDLITTRKRHVCFSLCSQVMRYAEQRIPTLNEYCVACDERHVFQNGPMLKPAVCTRELCVFSFYTLGVMTGATEEVATGAEVVDLQVAMCRAALQSSRKNIIFEPYPSVVDPYNPKTLAFSPKRKSYERLQKALDSILLIRRMAQGPYSEIKKQMDKIDPLIDCVFFYLTYMFILLFHSHQLKFMHTPHQFLLISSPPFKEARFQAARKLHGSTFAFHGSHIENWHSILRNGLINASYTKLQLHGAAYGKGIYLSPVSSISFGYSGTSATIILFIILCKQNVLIIQRLPLIYDSNMFLQTRNLNCIALCEVITSKHLQKHGNIWVCPISDHVCTRFLFVYENGQVGDVHINTQEARIHREILQVIASKPC
uniref:Poly [ADP-ribose] polymerase n=1 Tax=Sparus aurata TaxID=8175 RepID=A0A671WH75_SPAAU